MTPDLLPQHAALITASGITPAVAAARGYRTITHAIDAATLGFNPAQAARVPALLLPVHGVGGGVVTYQLRPDQPRERDGKPLKYETPAGSRMVLDVPPAARPALADPHVPLYITEGARKADAAVSQGACCIALLGVWNFRGTNEHGGKTALADWESVALNGRVVLIAFDSDVMTKPAVRGALDRLTAFLHLRGARVRWVHLPATPDGGKVGLDDYLATGHTMEEVDALATAALTDADTGATNDAGEEWIPPAEMWPAPLAEEAFYGLAGEIVRAVEAETEADPVGILANLLAMFGNAVNRAPHYCVGADIHRLNLNTVTVGATSAGGKGMASNLARAVMAHADAEWCAHIRGGLSSGEGLIWQIRDPITKYEYDKKTGQTNEVTADPGVTDKRLFVLETEFAGVLRQFQREGNTLSNILRDAWDGKDLAAMTKNSPARATHPHVSIFGHITKHELLRYLDNTEAANGLGNRFMWLCVQRSKLLPDGGSDLDFAPFGGRIAAALTFAYTVGQMRRDEEAGEMWHAIYGSLTEGKPGLLGAMIARAAPTVVRLSMIYALLDCSRVIRAEHLKAAVALWEYAEASAKWIFGDALGDPIADEILGALRRAPNGKSRTEIRDLLGRNQKAERIEQALTVLHTANLATCVQSGGGQGAGRPVERWVATRLSSSRSSRS